MSTPDLVSVLQRYVLAGFRLQLALRLVLAAFLGTTLVIERPQHRFWLCILILAVYLAIVALWAAWAFTRQRPRERLSPPVAFAVLLADVTVVGGLTAITGIASPHEWTSDVLSQGLYTVEPHEKAVVLRFGKYYGTVDPGLQFCIPLVDQVYKVSIEEPSLRQARTKRTGTTGTFFFS